MPTQLTYDITTDPQHLLASPQGNGAPASSFTLSATNNTGQPVTLKFISVMIPIGSGDKELTADASNITTQTGSKQSEYNWSPYASNPVLATDPNSLLAADYIFNPNTGSETLNLGDSLLFTFSGININTASGTAVITITEDDFSKTQVISLAKFPANFGGGITFTAWPLSISSGDDVTLNWNGPAGATYSIEYYMPQTGSVNQPSGNEAPLSNNGQQSITDVESTTTFTLSVSYTPLGEQNYYTQPQQTVTVGVAKPVINHFTGKMIAGALGLELILDWDTTSNDDTSVRLSGDDNVKNAVAKTRICPTADAPLLSTYTLTASNIAGSVEAQVKLIWDQVASVECGNKTEGVNNPLKLAVSPKSSYVYVICNSAVNFYGNTNPGELWTFNIGSDIVKNSVTKIRISPSGIATSPDGNFVYVSYSWYSQLSIFDANSLTELSIQEVPFGQFSQGLIVTQDRDFALFYTSNLLSNVVTAAQISNGKQLTGSPAAVGKHPRAIILSPDEQTLYVANSGSNTISVLNAKKNLQQIWTVPVGRNPTSLALKSDGSKLFVCNCDDLTISVLDITGNTYPGMEDPISISCSPMHIALSKDDAFLYSANNDNSFTIIDSVSFQPIKKVANLGSNPTDIAVSSDNIWIFVSCQDGTLNIISPSVIDSSSH